MDVIKRRFDELSFDTIIESDVKSWPHRPLTETPLDRENCRWVVPEEAAAGIVGSGYVVPSLEAALWAFGRTDDFRTGVLAAVNLGNDADTTGAIFGQLAGAYYGAEAIPVEWRRKVTLADEIVKMAEGLMGSHTGTCCRHSRERLLLCEIIIRQ